jgi:hypothetical protein
MDPSFLEARLRSSGRSPEVDVRPLQHFAASQAIRRLQPHLQNSPAPPSTFLVAYYFILSPALFQQGDSTPAFTVASLTTFVDDLKKPLNFLKNYPILATTSNPAITNSEDHPSDTLSKLSRFVQHTSASDLIAFIINPRFDDPAYLTTLVVALSAVFITMS